MTARTPVAAGTQPADLPMLLTPADVAALFGVDAKTVTRWNKAGKLPAALTTPGGHRRYSRDDVTPFLVRGAS